MKRTLKFYFYEPPPHTTNTMPPPLHTRGGGTIPGTTAFYYARRARTRATRAPLRFNVPTKVGIPDAPRKESERSTRLDILGPLIRTHHPVVADSSRANLFAAFDKRCNHFSDARVDPELIAASHKLALRLLPEPLDPLVYDMDLFEDWNSQFDGPKQKRHKIAYEKLSSITQSDFSDKQIFVKVEALLKRHDPNWAPRIIYQSSDLHNVLLGPVMWKCTKRLFSYLEWDSKESQVNYMGAYAKDSPSLVERINRFGTSDSVYVESDFTSNDMTQVRDVHLLEVFWLQRLGAPAWLTALMMIANSFKASSRTHRVSARITNQLPTGAQSTTFRNSMWNCTINYAFCQRVKATGDVLILGDDMLMRYDNPISSRVKNIRREYEHVCKLACMKAKVFVRKHLSECTFLSKQFIMTDNERQYVMIPLLGKAVARFNVRASANDAVSDEAYLAGKALSYAYEFRFAPTISRLFYYRYQQLVPPEGVSLDALGWNAKGAFLRRGTDGVIAAIENATNPASADDLTRFYHWKYELCHQEVVELLLAMIFGEDDLDEEGIGYICSDFL